MAESKKEKAGRLQQRREKQQAKREKTNDTPEAAAERRKQPTEFDERTLKKTIGSGVILT